MIDCSVFFFPCSVAFLFISSCWRRCLGLFFYVAQRYLNSKAWERKKVTFFFVRRFDVVEEKKKRKEKKQMSPSKQYCHAMISTFQKKSHAAFREGKEERIFRSGVASFSSMSTSFFFPAPPSLKSFLMFCTSHAENNTHTHTHTRTHKRTYKQEFELFF